MSSPSATPTSPPARRRPKHHRRRSSSAAPRPDQSTPRPDRGASHGRRQTGSRQATSRQSASRQNAPRQDRNTSHAPRHTSRPDSVRPEIDRPEIDRPNTGRADAPGVEHFTELNLPDVLIAALAEAGIQTPTPIQAQALPDALAGRDVLGRARTGSGKTLAFGLPMLTRLAAGAPTRGSSRPRGLILLPTRELAQQVESALEPLADVLSMRMLVVVGGSPINRQITQLRRGIDVLVATPGRLLDLMERRAVTLDGVSVAVLDEADQMADLGFLPAVTRILDAVPEGGQRLLFSATLDRGVDRIVAKYLSRPAVHQVDQAGAPPPAMEHRIFRLVHEDKVSVASELGMRTNRTLFFVRTKHGAGRLARQMRTRGVDAGALHGDMSQSQRRRALDAFTSGQTTVLVATDVAARGLHVDDLDLVVHFDPPADHKTYAHRSGRTARAGASGTVISFVEPQQVGEVKRIHAAAEVSARASTIRPGHPEIREFVTPDAPKARATAR